MAFHHRPTSHADRDKVVSAIETFRARVEPDPGVIVLEERIFSQARSAYSAAARAYHQAEALKRTATEAVQAADERFDKALREWVRTVNDSRGRSLSGQLSKLLGGTKTGRLVELPFRKELNKINVLFGKLPEVPDLRGDEAKLASLKAAAVELEPLVDQYEAATRDLLTKGRDYTEATLAFDASYAKLAKAVLGLLGQTGAFAILPRFRRGTTSPPEPPAEPAPPPT